jgi:hypothetical protein
MASYQPPKKNTAFIMYIALEDSANPGLFKATPTLATGDFKVSIDGGALANLATLPTNTPAASKMVKISLSSGEMNGDNITIICSDAAGAEWRDLVINLQTAPSQFGELAAATVDEILDEVVDGTYTFRQVLRLLASFVAAEASGGGTTSVIFRDISDTKARITMTVDSLGNRSALTLDAT